MAFQDNIKQTSVQLDQIKTYTPAVKVGDVILPAGIGGDFIPGGLIGEPYVVVSDSGQLKVQKLSFTGTTPTDEGSLQQLGDVKVFATGHPEPEGGGEGTVEAVAGYAVNVNGVITFHSIEDSSSQSIAHLKIVNTGVQEPAYQAAGSSIEFYKCTSVNTSDATWSGYKAVLNGDIYTFQSNSTQNLIYTNAVPIIGNIYSSDVLIRVSSFYSGVPQRGLVFGVPQRGLVFYAPLNSSSAITGQQFTSKNVSFASQAGFAHNVAYFKGSAYLNTSNVTNLPYGNSPRCFSVWVKPQTISGTSCIMATYDGNSTSSGVLAGLFFYRQNESYAVSFSSFGNGPDVGYATDISTGKWIHVIGQVTDTSFDLYVNGDLVASTSNSGLATTNGYLQIGALNYGGFGRYYTGYAAQARIYNRALTTSEITALASEFRPSNS